MKTSKRLLSIVLMLAMFVSMFTVMAFAHGDSVTVNVEIEGNGTGNVKLLTYGGDVVKSGSKSFSYTFDAANLEGAAAIASADANCTAKLYYDGAVVGSNAIDLSDFDHDVTLKAVFTKADSKEDLPEKGHDLTLKINDGGVKGAKVLGYGTELPDGFAITLFKGDAVEFTTQASEDYTVVWKLGNKVVSKKASYKLDKTLTEDTTLTVTFTPVEPVTEEYRLTANVEKIGSKYPGYVKYDSTEDTSVRVNVEKGDTVTLRATAKTGYKFYKWVSDDITISSSDAKNSKLVLTMPGRDVKVTATFKEDSSYTGEYRLKLDIGSHGEVTRNDRVVEDGKYYDLSRGDEITFKATADRGYEVVWRIDNGTKHYTSKITVDTSDMGYDDATLHIDFVKSGSSTDTKAHTLTVDISGSKYGKVTSKNSKVSDGDTFSLEKNETRTFKAEPDTGYLAVWTFGTEVYVGSSYTVKMGSKNATLYVDFVDKDSYRWGNLPFHDVSNKNWYYDDVVYAYVNGLMDGISMTEFGANQNTTRAQVVTILWRLTGEPRVTKSNSFTDVSSKAYYNTAISWAAENGIVKGYDAKTFRPDAYVTREQLAAILYRYAEYMNLSLKGASNLMKFDDYYSIGTWARDSLAWANYHGLINGVDSYHIDPKGNTTRAQLAAILHRFAVEFG